jgi:hypothetical protein
MFDGPLKVAAASCKKYRKSIVVTHIRLTAAVT